MLHVGSLGGTSRLPPPRFESLFNSNSSAYFLFTMIWFLLGWSSFFLIFERDRIRLHGVTHEQLSITEEKYVLWAHLMRNRAL